MNLSEFKAWFEGFTENLDGAPNAKAWKRICDRVKSIKSDEPTARHVFHDYYVRPWRRWYDQTSYLAEGSYGSGVQLSNAIAYQSAEGLAHNGTDVKMLGVNVREEGVDRFDSQTEFNRLGRAEALSISSR